MPGGPTVLGMMQGKANSGTGPVPTITFRATDLAGTTPPRVGAAQSTTGATNAGQFAGVKPMHIAVIVLVIIGAGYLLHHMGFEESVKIG